MALGIPDDLEGLEAEPVLEEVAVAPLPKRRRHTATGAERRRNQRGTFPVKVFLASKHGAQLHLTCYCILELCWPYEDLLDGRVGTSIQQILRDDLKRWKDLSPSLAVVWRARILKRPADQPWELSSGSVMKIDPVCNFAFQPRRAATPDALALHSELRIPLGDARVMFAKVILGESSDSQLYFVTPSSYLRWIPVEYSALPEKVPQLVDGKGA